ncbi:putative RNA methyltransferase [Candidatus Solirubrobacter pratensis]|uniref:putative RNA methyltransferase n=1 Tax=Candidatus Solirubrobacter pratensis TaxID=1298857 RepID=UPI0003FAF3C5|nr:methyltransferase domain-containing protein [Candidatus Solirubrobacter pratensis]
MLAGALPYLRCPHCGAALHAAGSAIRCEAGHSFDVARQGYVDLMPPGRRPAGDTAEMVAARAAFLGAGHYEAIAEAVAAEAAGGDGCVVEVGAGTGHYVERAAAGRVAIALDTSRYALRRAARAGLAAVGCDAWRALPVRDGVASAVLCVFAPRHADELRRILAPGGRLVVVTPTPRHLAELVSSLELVTVDARKPQRLARALGEPDREQLVEERLELSREDVRALIAMGPSARHVDADAVARAAETTLSVRVAVYGR